MPISFAPLARLIPMTRLKRYKVVGGGTYDVIRAAVDAPIREGISISTIDAICAYLGCQPGDIMEYVPDEPNKADAPGKPDGPERDTGAREGLYGDAGKRRGKTCR